MKYYYYGSDAYLKGGLRANEMQKEDSPIRKFGELIIEEDTIYEIDEACLDCQKKRENCE